MSNCVYSGVSEYSSYTGTLRTHNISKINVVNKEVYLLASVSSDAFLVLGNALRKASVDAEGLKLFLITFLPAYSLSS